MTDCGQWAVSGSGQGPRRASDTLRSPPFLGCGHGGPELWLERPAGCVEASAVGGTLVDPLQREVGLKRSLAYPAYVRMRKGVSHAPGKAAVASCLHCAGSAAGLAPKLCPLHRKQVQNLTDRVGVLEECI